MDKATASDAVRALAARGVDTAADLLECATPDEILAACRRWDGRKGVGPGLLAKWIRSGDFTDPAPQPAVSKGAQLRARFDEYARRYPVGAITESHRDLIARRWPDDLEQLKQAGAEPCAGSMVVFAADYPVLEIECDVCGFVVGMPPRALPVLPGGLLDEARP